MPKGVEHGITALLPVFVVVDVESLMPKGVEHIMGRKFALQSVGVESLMPKGVEHEQIDWLLQDCHRVSNL